MSQARGGHCLHQDFLMVLILGFRGWQNQSHHSHFLVRLNLLILSLTFQD